MEARKNEIDAAIGLLKISSLKRRRLGIGVKVKKTNLQQTVLKTVFEITVFPSTETRNELALLLGISKRSVQVWFQNKRQISKKKDTHRSNGGDKHFFNEYPKFTRAEYQNDHQDEFVCDIPSTKLFSIIKYCYENEEFIFNQDSVIFSQPERNHRMSNSLSIRSDEIKLKSEDIQNGKPAHKPRNKQDR